MASKAMVRGFLECAAWTATDDSDQGNPLADDLDWTCFDADSRALAMDLCTRFLDLCGETLVSEATSNKGDGVDSESGGHDLWLTMQGHGAGFWDGDWSHGEALKDACDKLPPSCEFWRVTRSGDTLTLEA